MIKAAVIGAGISGLTTAYLLKQKNIDVKIFEKQLIPGGNIRSEKINGYLIEHGPNSTLETTPLLDILFEKLGIIENKVYASDTSNKRYILKNGRLHALPMSPPAFFKTKLFSASAKLRLFKEPFIKSKSNDTESIAEFTIRRLGQEFLDYAINPFVAGVFAGNPDEINVKASFPKLFALEQKYGSLIRGTIKSRKDRKKRAEKSKQSAKSFSFLNGMGELTEALCRKLDGNLFCGAEAIHVKNSNGGFELTCKSEGKILSGNFDVIIISSPSYAAVKILSDFGNGIPGELQNIYYPPVSVVYTGFINEALGSDLDGFGYLVPEKEKRKILGSLWSSVIFPGRAGDGYSLLTNFIGGSRNPELALEKDDKLFQIVMDELKSVIKVKKEPDFVKIVRWEKAIPQYSKEHARLTDKLDRFMENNKGLYICSNFYRGISISDCVSNAYATADKVMEYIKIFNIV
jgi:protoporphyrinogen/coproporphyrinogen III oxidase